MNRIGRCFSIARKNKRRALIPYIAAGDPHPRETVDLMHTLVHAGADMIELGVPFSDPVADGAAIQQAYERALSHQVSLVDVLNMVHEFRRQDVRTPIILMGYQNPVEAMGQEKFARYAAQSGVDGVLTVDLPVEESADSQRALSAQEITSVLLLSPTTSPERLAIICSASRVFIYYVSLKGVTGASHIDTHGVAAHLQKIRRHTSLPIGVGFGIKNAVEAAQVAAFADGIVIGSALVEIIGDVATAAVARHDKVARKLSAIRCAIDAVTVTSESEYGLV